MSSFVGMRPFSRQGNILLLKRHSEDNYICILKKSITYLVSYYIILALLKTKKISLLRKKWPDNFSTTLIFEISSVFIPKIAASFGLFISVTQAGMR
jgi:hypothetical protein